MGQQFLDLEGTKILANKIKENVKKINDIASGIGGRNLALGTEKAIGDVSGGNGGSSYSATDLFSGITAIKTNTAWTGRYVNLKAIAQRGGFKAGDNLVLSVYIKADQNVTLNVSCHRTKGTGNTSGSSKAYTNFTVTPKWQQVWFPFVADEGSLNRVDARIEVDVATGNNYIHWAGWKLEKGNIVTDWTPAPEDIDSAIGTKVNSAVNELKVGGSNVLRNGNFAYDMTNWSVHDMNSGGSGKSVTVSSGGDWIPSGKKALQIKGTNTTDRYGVMSSTMKLIPKTKYTISGYCAGHRVNKIQVNVRDKQDGDANIHTININQVSGGSTLDKWHRFETTFTTSSNSDFALNLYSVNLADNGYVWFCDVQIQQGTKATSWTPAPEDIDTTLGNKAEKSHNHDDRYYTESEINSKIDTINNNINGKANSNHTHDDRYYTESEINNTLTTYQKAYTDLSQLGLTTSNTIVDIITALPNKSTFTFAFGDSNNNTILGKQMPYEWGTLCIVKVDGSRTIIEFNTSYNNQKTVVSSKYYCNYNSSKKEISEWVMYGMSNNISNPNLLINGDFQVWQRGLGNNGKNYFNCVNANVYTADRFMVCGEHGTSLIAQKQEGSGIKLVFQDHTLNTSNIRTYFDRDDILKMVGKTYTYSVEYQYEYNDPWGNGLSIFSYPNNSVKASHIKTKKIEVGSKQIRLEVTFRIDSVGDDTTKMHIQWLRSKKDVDGFGYHIIRYVKLEEGSVATPFVSKPYMNELEDCQKYFVPMTWSHHTWHHGFGQNNWLFIPLPNKMRIAPTLWDGASVPANWSLCSNGSAITPTAVTVRTLGGNGVLLQFTGSFKNNYALIGFYNSATLGGFDAEIY